VRLHLGTECVGSAFEVGDVHPGGVCSSATGSGRVTLPPPVHQYSNWNCVPAVGRC